MTVPNDTVEADRVTDNIDVSVVDRDEGVFQAVNESHDDPSEHEYKIFCDDDGDAYHCTCPAFEYGNTDENGNCKHMRVVEQFCRHLDYKEWQVRQKEQEEEQRRQAEEAQVEDMDSGLPRDVVFEGILDAVLREGLGDEDEAEQDDEEELSAGAHTDG